MPSSGPCPCASPAGRGERAERSMGEAPRLPSPAPTLNAPGPPPPMSSCVMMATGGGCMDIGGGRDCCLWLRTAGMLSWIEPEPEPAKKNARYFV